MQNTFDLLNLSAWRVITCAESEDRYVIQATPGTPRSPCPACGSNRTFKHGSDAQMLHDLPCHGKRVTISVNRQRYRCVDCRKTWFEVLRARLLYGQHLLRQTRRPKPKADNVLEVENVGSLLGDAVESTLVQLPLPL